MGPYRLSHLCYYQVTSTNAVRVQELGFRVETDLADIVFYEIRSRVVKHQQGAVKAH